MTWWNGGYIIGCVWLQNVYDKQMGHEFRNEIETLRCIEHRNLVRFHGFLEDGGEQLIVVEYVPNGNLREHLEGMSSYDSMFIECNGFW